MDNLYYVGMRESDICNSSAFVGTITRYGTNCHNNISYTKKRLSAFSNNPNYTKFMVEQINKIIDSDSNAKFVFSNQLLPYKLGEKIFNKSLGVNSLALINLFNDRFFVRQFPKDYIPTPQSYVMHKQDLKRETMDRLFAQYNFLVIQEAGGSGGKTTYIRSKNQLQDLQNLNKDYYLISGFVENNTPISVHLLLSSNNVYVFQPSVQIIKNKSNYYGGDFAKVANLSSEIKYKIKQYSFAIGQKLLDLGYRGVFGINYVESMGELFFLEINLRFMGSTFLLNKHLISQGLKTLQEYHIDAYLDNIIDLSDYDFEQIIKLSNIIRFNNEPELTSQGAEIILDGYDSKMETECDAYLYTAVYNHSII